MNNLYEPKSGVLTVRYLPDGEVCNENPPRFSWIPTNEENKWYVLQISKDENFSKEGTITYKDLPYNFFAPDKCLECGKYFWRYGLQSKDGISYSSVRNFTIDENAVRTPVPSYKTRFKDVDCSHPRIWMNQKKIQEFRDALKKNPSHCNFDRFMENCVKPRMSKKIISEPARYPNDKRVVHLWRQNYMDCQEAYNYVKFLAVAAVILEDKELTAQAIEGLLSVANWDVNGSTGRDYNDECAFRVEETLSWGYDWLYNDMTQEQRNAVRKVLLFRTEQVAKHAMISSKIHYSLFDSHAVRSLSSALVPACIAMLNEEDQAKQWLNYTVDYLSVLYTPWGGIDGGWAEGGLYWTTGMAYLISALDILKNYTGIDIFKRPFFQQTGSFPLYCFPHDTYRASFCDQSNLGEKPILKTGFNAREFAGVTGNGEYQWYFEQIAKRESYNDTRFFNIGWWDFYFDELMYLSNYDNVQAQEPKSGRNVKWFKDIGWVAVHKDMQNEDDHISFITKSSPYGSVSHSHGDQNSMLLFAFGEPLLIETGYYIGFNTSMHRDWRKKTLSQNTLLIDGKGQYFGMDKTIQLASSGTVVDVSETENCVHIIEDATNGYKVNVPYLNNYTREIYFVDDTYFIVVDQVELAQQGDVDFQLHTLFKPEYIENRFHVSGEKAEMSCEFIYVSAGTQSIDINDRFDGVNPKEIEGLDNNWHFKLHTGKAKKHVIVSCIHPKKVNENNSISVIKDDQGHDVYFYFNNDGKTYTVCIDGSKRY